MLLFYSLTLLVLANIHNLDTNNVRLLSRTNNTLTALGDISYPYLLNGTGATSARIANRCEALTNKRKENLYKWCKDQVFNRHGMWVDMVPSKYFSTKKDYNVYLEQGRELVGTHNSPTWLHYQHGFWFFLSEKITEGYTASELVDLINTVEKAGWEWTRRYGKNFNPPTLLPEEL